MNNTITDKALWLVEEGRVQILTNEDFYTYALVEGMTGTYQVTEDPEGWHCDCEAGQHHVRCSHIEATAIQRGSE